MKSLKKILAIALTLAISIVCLSACVPDNELEEGVVIFWYNYLLAYNFHFQVFHSIRLFLFRRLRLADPELVELTANTPVTLAYEINFQPNMLNDLEQKKFSIWGTHRMIEPMRTHF